MKATFSGLIMDLIATGDRPTPDAPRWRSGSIGSLLCHFTASSPLVRSI